MKKRFLGRVCLRYQFLAMSLFLAGMLLLSGCAVPMRRVVAQQQQPVGSMSRIAVLVSDRARLPQGLPEELQALETDFDQIATQPVDALLVSRDFVIDAGRDLSLRSQLLEYLDQHKLLLIYQIAHKEFFERLELVVPGHSSAVPAYAVIGVIRLEDGGWGLGGVVASPVLVNGLVTVQEEVVVPSSTVEQSPTLDEDAGKLSERKVGVGGIIVNGAPTSNYVPETLVRGIDNYVSAEVRSVPPADSCDTANGSMLHRDHLVFEDYNQTGVEFAEVIWLCQRGQYVFAQATQETSGPRSWAHSSENRRPVRRVRSSVSLTPPATQVDHRPTTLGAHACLEPGISGCRRDTGNVEILDTSNSSSNHVGWVLDYKGANPFAPPPESLETHVTQLEWQLKSDSPTVSFAKETTIDVGGWLTPVKQSRVTHLIGLEAASLALADFGVRLNPEHTSIVLNWQTDSETRILAFYLERAENREGPYVEVYQASGEGDPTHGASYRYEDLGVTPGVTYWYRLQALTYVGQMSFGFTPLSITAVADTPAPTPAAKP